MEAWSASHLAYKNHSTVLHLWFKTLCKSSGYIYVA